jgi:hypothetical protein
MRTIAISLEGVEPALAVDLERVAASRPAPLSLAEVCELRERSDDIRLAMTGGARARTGTAMLGRAVRVGGVTLRSISLGGTIALRRLVCWAPLLDQVTYDILEAWVYAHSWSQAELSRLTDPAACEEIVAEWFPRLTCTREELAAAVAALCESQPAASTENASSPQDQVLDSLLMRYGGDAIGWLETPVARINALAEAARANDLARDAQMAREAGTLPPAARDQRVNAVGAYVRTRERLLKGEAKANG